MRNECYKQFQFSVISALCDIQGTSSLRWNVLAVLASIHASFG